MVRAWAKLLVGDRGRLLRPLVLKTTRPPKSFRAGHPGRATFS
jgi:hypothetical protein